MEEKNLNHKRLVCNPLSTKFENPDERDNLLEKYKLLTLTPLELEESLNKPISIEEIEKIIKEIIIYPMKKHQAQMVSQGISNTPSNTR